MALSALADGAPSWVLVGVIFVSGWFFELGWGTAGRLATLETKMDIVQADVVTIRGHLLGASTDE